MNLDAFRENVCIITGASSGIGRELALLLAENGAWLALAARNERRLHATAEACRQLGGRALVVPTDVSREGDCAALVKRTAEEFGRIDTLVNNAGISMTARFDEMEDLTPLHRITEVNYYGSVYCTYYALPYLLDAKGRVVGVASLTGKTGVPTRSFYAATKHAMAGFFDSLRIELADRGVSVTMIYPGFVQSEVRERALGPDGRPRGESHIEESSAMPADECARLIARAAARRQREVVMTLKAKVGMWVKLIAPGLMDQVAKKTIEEGR